MDLEYLRNMNGDHTSMITLMTTSLEGISNLLRREISTATKIKSRV